MVAPHTSSAHPATTAIGLLAVAMAVGLLLGGCATEPAEEPAPSEQTADDTAASEEDTMQLVSSAFSDNSKMPVRFAKEGAGGENISPPYEWSDVPGDAVSLAFVVYDAAPIADEWLHWVVTDIAVDTAILSEAASGTRAMGAGTVEHLNTFGEPGWGGPQPPPGSGVHEYVATVYALDVETLELPDAPTLADVASALEEHVLAEATYTGTFEQ